MAFITVYGKTNSENGWRMCDAAQCDTNPIPGTSVSIPLQRGIPNTILKAFAADLNAYIEPVMNARGGSDEGGWTPTNSVATSNHLSGSAFDYNWSDHPMGNANAGWNGSVLIKGDQVPAVRELLAWYEGMVFWGNDWSTPKDSMHFQMGYNTYNNQAKCADFIARKIRADGFSTYRRAPATAQPTGPVDPIVAFQAWKVQASDRQLLEYIVDQLGPGNPFWKDSVNGETLREKAFGA
jgi:putative chitinase